MPGFRFKCETTPAACLIGIDRGIYKENVFSNMIFLSFHVRLLNVLYATRTRTAERYVIITVCYIVPGATAKTEEVSTLTTS